MDDIKTAAADALVQICLEITSPYDCDNDLTEKAVVNVLETVPEIARDLIPQIAAITTWAER